MLERLEATLSDANGAAAWKTVQDRVRTGGAAAFAEALPALARKVGRAPLGGGVTTIEDGGTRPPRVDLDRWRACDAAGALLAETARLGDDAFVDLYLHGDLEERTILLRALTVRPITAATARLLEEAQRTNMVVHFEAAACDSNLPARAAAHPSFGREGFCRLILKAAFLDLAAERLFDAEALASPELSRMLQDLATEREAAGRSVWNGTNRLIAHAPVAGTVARLVGGLEHGDDRVRMSAAEGLAVLLRRRDGDGSLRAFALERLEREPRAAIRDALQRAIGP
jgi:hypothetical protein